MSNGRNKDGTFNKTNTYWQQRKKHGRNKDYTPDELINELFNYVDWSNENDFEQKEISKKMNRKKKSVITVVKIKNLKRPVTLRGFNQWLGKGGRYFQQLKDAEGSTDYSYVKSYIKNAIESEQLQYALAGIIKPVTVNSLI